MNFAAKAVITIEINNQYPTGNFRLERLRRAAALVLEGEGISSALLSLAVVDDATSHALNRRYLHHDYPTDVLSFPLDDQPDYLEGEVVVSADHAAQRCEEFGWTAEDELLLYVIHGVLHLTGYDDHSEEDRVQMRRREQHYLRKFNLHRED